MDLMRRGVGVVSALWLGCAGGGSAFAGEPAVSVDDLPSRFCQLEKLEQPLRFLGGLTWPDVRCVAETPSGCTRCEGTPRVSLYPLTLELPTVSWDHSGPSWDCLSAAPYQQSGGIAYEVRGVLPKALFDHLPIGQSTIPLSPLEPLKAVSYYEAISLQMFPVQQDLVVSFADLLEYVCPLPNDPVTLVGTMGFAPTVCTENACDEGNPCCQGCMGLPVLEGKRMSLVLSMAGVSCEGNNCTGRCSGLTMGAGYEVTGRLSYSDEGTLRMEVSAYHVVTPGDPVVAIGEPTPPAGDE